ncbi:30S ribosomal protein S6 [Kosmotoga arenicorallina S304]|uniref:Small ribosomal subunit protein bS6 n=1 Tax=Kosmotoga arenicorallina S304 TaxID=1453497 RepID=A0A176K0I3_9BACT|nr:30S ribosomal protein S6 [Kosmotoga arenicorallina]OAA30128.1 30S ribosomal protein S6 [Kosmotoga arenicorallina S304]
MSEKRIYETMFIVSPQLDEEQRNDLAEKVKNYIEERVGGEIEKFDRWGMRKLAYRVRKGFTEGDYTLILFRADPEKVNVLERLFNITPDIFRWQTFRREDLEKEEKKKEKPEVEKAPEEVVETIVETAPETVEEVSNDAPATEEKPEEKAEE